MASRVWTSSLATRSQCDPGQRFLPVVQDLYLLREDRVGRGVEAGWIEQLAAAVHGDLQPECTLLLDLPVAVGLRRARSRSGAAADRFEAELESFFERVRAGYLAIARDEPRRVRVIDAGGSVEEVSAQVASVLESL